MENETDIGSEDSREVLEDVSSTNTLAAAEYERAILSGTVYSKILEFDEPRYFWAYLQVDYWWAGDGTILYGYARRYRALNNGRSRGDITFAVRGTSGQSWERLLTDRAVQDGKWHDIDGGGWVSSPLRLGELYFKFIFDVANGPDPSHSALARIVNPPAITPIAGPIEGRYSLTITGVATGPVTLTVQTESGTIISGAFTPTGNTRTFTPSAAWAPGELKVKVVQFVDGEASPPSALVTLNVSPSTPTIDYPARNAVVKEPRHWVSGRGSEGATVTLYHQNLGTQPLGTAIVAANTQWQINPVQVDLWQADPFNFHAIQHLAGISSQWSEVVPVTVLFKPIITHVVLSGLRPTVVGVGGLAGATLEIWIEGGTGGAWLTTTVLSNGSWQVSATSDWAVGSHTITARQIAPVSKAVSDWALNYGFSIVQPKPPKPAITPITQPIEGRHALTITGVAAGTVTLTMLTDAGGTVAGAYTGSGTSRTFTPTAAWTPAGEKRVKVVQTVGGVPSDPSDVVTLKVKPPKPAITPVTQPIEGRHALTITGALSGVVNLTMQTGAGVRIDGAYSPASRGSYTFTPTEAWPPGTQTVKVVQAVDGVSSDPSDVVTLTVRFPKPVITFPTSATVIREPQHAMSGTGLPGARVTLYHQNQGTSPLGSVDVLNDQTWNIPASALDRNFWMADPFNLMAIQRLGTADSEWSDVVGVPVIFKPIIDGVTVDGLKPTVRGSGGLKGAELQIWISSGEGGGQLTTAVRENGTWEVAATVDWAVKTHTITARQLTPVSKKESNWSDTLSFTIVDPKPPKPVITPVTQPIEGRFGLTITGVAAGTVTLTMLTGAGGAVAGEFTGTGSTRTFIPAAAWTPPGEQTVKVVQTVGGVPSDPSDLVTLKVRPPKPGIEPPSAPIEATQPLTVMGIYSDAVTLKMLDDDNNEVTGNFTGSGDRRDFTPDPAWAAGEHHVKVVQTLQNITSAPSDLCTFIVDASLKPPVFEVPVAGSNSSSSPQISGTSEPYAEVTVQHVNGPELFTGPADADGKWAFVVKEHFDLGPQALEASQVHQGVGSGWSKEAHTFEVIQTPVNPPSIERPGNNSTVSPPFWFSGSGIGQAQVSLRVKQGNEVKGTDAVTVNGSRNWTSRPQFVLPSGITYTLEAQQRYGAEESGWTVPPRIFSVSASLFEFADAAPVIGQPVVENQESVWLRVRAVSVNTGRGVEGLEVRWYLEQQVELAMTLTDEHGWARYQYAPQVPGEHTVWADMSAENEQVTVVQPFSVMALQKDAWAREFDLFMNGERVDLATMELVFQYDKHYSFVLVPKPGSPLIGFTYVALEHLPGAEMSGLSVTPPLGVPVDLDAEVVVHWDVIVHTQTSGFYGLKLTCPKLPDWQLPVRVISRDFANEAEVLFDGVAMGFGKSKAYPCHGATHTITVKPKPESPLLNKAVQLLWRGESAESLGISISPSLEYFPVLTPEGISWTLNCVNGLKNGDFSLALVSDELGFTSLDFPLSLGHNKVKIIDWDGPTEIGIGGGWRRGICVASEFTGRVVSVPVTVLITGREPYTDTTSVTGWCYVVYPDDKTVDFKLHNRYEGQLLE